MGKYKQVMCKICYKEMRSDTLVRHMKVHQPKVKTIEKSVQTDSNPLETKSKCEEPRNKDFSVNLKFDPEALEKAALEKHEVYLEKIALGEELYKILGKGVVTEESFPIDWKDALDSYMCFC